MTSGALLLDENRKFSMRDLFMNRIFRTILLLMVWSAVYAIGYGIIAPLIDGSPIQMRGVITSFIMGHFHLWYLYMLIGLYLALPFLRTIVSKANKHLVLLYLGISLFIQFTAPIIRIVGQYWDLAAYITAFLNKFYLNFFCGYISYYLIGWYITHVGISKQLRYLVYLLSLLAVVATILYVNITGDYVNAYDNMNLLVFIYSTGAFLAINSIRLTPKEHTKNGIIKISRYSFGMYVVHVLFLSIARNLIPPSLIITPFNLLLRLAIVFLLSWFTTFLLSKIPFVKKAVRI